MRTPAVILFFLAVVVAGAGSASAFGSEKPPTVGVVMPADPRGPVLARFAVLVYSLSRNAKLTYAGVSGVDQRPDKGGVRYQMVVTAVDAAGATGMYRAVVWGIPETSRWTLMQFKRIN
ncbi:Cysteine proteinase inhibitor [Hordeum vulgare]|uniref:Cysteine proteinase inhibitor n=1 Tax=Hordeum vulgare subsp. vulgare TaxID=112509 RepID=A0A8I6Y9V3_HORVV|nr:Cysteine proteinase inhibitor [Hordeum vulgare]KAI4992727.1 hypothetical protein ZWY2020_007040 [Hordeum vulgare]